jgi:hypothetical protein
VSAFAYKLGVRITLFGVGMRVEIKEEVRVESKKTVRVMVRDIYLRTLNAFHSISIPRGALVAIFNLMKRYLTM